jgi:hypothetical protein
LSVRVILLEDRILTGYVVSSNQMLEVFHGEQLVLGEQLHATFKNLGCCRVLVTVVFDKCGCHVDITRNTTSLS